MSAVKTFVNVKTGEVTRAILVTEKNLVTATNWASKYADAVAVVKTSKTGDLSDHRIKIKTPKGWRVVRVGEFVVRHESKSLLQDYVLSVGKDEYTKNNRRTTFAAQR